MRTVYDRRVETGIEKKLLVGPRWLGMPLRDVRGAGCVIRTILPVNEGPMTRTRKEARRTDSWESILQRMTPWEGEDPVRRWLRMAHAISLGERATADECPLSPSFDTCSPRALRQRRGETRTSCRAMRSYSTCEPGQIRTCRRDADPGGGEDCGFGKHGTLRREPGCGSPEPLMQVFVS